MRCVSNLCACMHKPTHVLSMYFDYVHIKDMRASIVLRIYQRGMIE
jgi:hypothetical protein